MISEKQQKIMAFPYSKYDALICDGAVRSGKTSIMMWSFVRWAMESFNGQRFGVCGRTVDSCTKNIIVPFTAMGLAKEKYLIRWRRGDKVMEVRRGAVTNYFEVFGGKDEASYTLIQGRTLAGVLLDEVVLMPRSFVEQALTRCSVDGAKLWFSCNPGSPQHWFYTEWIQRHEARNTLYLHFEMTDNPGLSQKTLERYQAMFSGVFYDRYIRGLWVLAEGLIYPMFGEGCLVDNPPQGGRYYISCDYGTLNPFSAGLWCWDGKTATRVAEYYYSGRQEQRHKTDEDYYTALEQLAGDKPVQAVIVDPSAASFIEALRREGFPVSRADNDVADGIRVTANLLKQRKIVICEGCESCLAEIAAYCWEDGGTGRDRPKKERDHAMDEMRYFAVSIAKKERGGGIAMRAVERAAR